MIYPWQQEAWLQLTKSAFSQRFPHALLLTGVAGLGKRDFAVHLARGLLCQKQPLLVQHQPDDHCDCRSCQLMHGGVHPNLFWIEPEKEGHPIKVDAIREGCEFVMQTSASPGYRCLIIHPANKMNLNAANALLKTLEEPPSDAVIILVSDQDAYLPATIVSRCQRIVFSKPQEQLAKTWLQNQVKKGEYDWSLLLALANGAPLAALALASSDSFPLRQIFFNLIQSFSNKQGHPIYASQQLQELDLITFLDWMSVCMMDVMRVQTNCQDFLRNRDHTDKIVTLSKQTKLTEMHQLLSIIHHYREQVLSGINLNKTLLMEHLFIRLKEGTA